MARPAVDCETARPLIDAYLLAELNDADGRRLANHVRTCVGCAAELGGATRVVGLLATLPTPNPAPDLDERIILAAIADRQHRHEQRSWLSGLPALVLRGAMRTTGTLIVTVVAVALLGSVFVFAASGFIAQTAQLFPPSGTVAPEVTPTLAPTHEQTAAPTASPTQETPEPVVVVPTPSSTPEATVAPTASPSLSPSPTVVATPEPTPTPTPSESTEPSPTPSATAEPTPTPTPIPTEKPRRTPPATPTPSPSNPLAPETAPTASP
jgi:hypothetical protein